MVNAKHDAVSYENYSYKHEIFNIESLYNAFQESKKDSDWKATVQRFEMNLLSELVRLERDIKNRTYRLSKTNDFTLRERGKVRFITGDDIRDRVVKRALCDEVLLPAIRPKLIYDNGASLEGKGITFTRSRLDVHLQKYYMENGNDGYIWLNDYSKFFDNIQHGILMNMFREVVTDETSLWLLEMILDSQKVDVSYMTDEEYAVCMDTLFDSIEYNKIDKSLLTGERFMRKHVNIGDQISQVAGIYYPTKIDNFVKIVRGEKYYGRYMDDSYIIHKDKRHLQELSSEIAEVAKSIGITLNPKKTIICKLSSAWRFLKIQYSLTDTGRIIKKIHPDRLTKMRHKLKALAGRLPEMDFDNLYKSWFKNHYKIMSKLQRKNMNEVYRDLKERYYA